MKIYYDRKIVLLTKHSKEEVIKPILELETGCELITESRFDTDKLGTFSRDIKRPKSQLDTARLKIKKGMKLTNADIGIASEGSFGSHPIAPIPWNVELVLLYDKKEKFEIYGVHESSDTNFNHKKAKNYEEVLLFAEKIGFPEHYLILRPDHENSNKIIKDVNSYEKLREAYFKCSELSKMGDVFVETDMRAHANPTRMKNIQKATENLVSKLLSLCPNCDSPGFIVTEVVRGLPCELCGLASEMVLKYIYICYKCKHKKVEYFPNGHTTPAQYCNYCNP
ncbi:MAG: DUF6671 family protein [Clostridia bacterium]